MSDIKKPECLVGIFTEVNGKEMIRLHKKWEAYHIADKKAMVEEIISELKKQPWIDHLSIHIIRHVMEGGGWDET